MSSRSERAPISHAPIARSGLRPWTIVAVIALVCSALALVDAERATAAPVPAPQFRDDVIFDGLTNPTMVAFAPDGRVLVAEKSGIIKSFPGLLAGATPTVVADLRTQTYNFWDRGLMAITLDPDFATNSVLYAAYTYDFDPAQPQLFPRWGTAGVDGDPCPNPPGATAAGCVVTARVSRLTLGASGMVSEQVLVTDWCQQFPSHSIGDLAFGPDGMLYVSGGDGASFTFTDIGQAGSPPNPCGDPVREGGSLRAQDLRTPGDPTTLDGTVIRIDPATGFAAPGNPLAGSGDTNRDRIIASGLRNPFRMTFRPGTGELYVAAVGAGERESVFRVDSVGDAVVENFGWPCFEGSAPNAAFMADTSLTICQDLLADPGAVTAPAFEYGHYDSVVPNDGCPTGSSSATGVAFYPSGPFPDRFDGAMFVADYSRRCIWAVRAGADGRPDPARTELIVRQADNPVDLKLGPDRNLYYVDLVGGAVHRVSFDSSNVPPVAAVVASHTTGTLPLSVGFDASGSTDPDSSAPLSFSWDLDGDGTFGDAGGAVVERTYTVGGLVDVKVRVTDAAGASTTRSVLVAPGASSIPTPSAGGWTRNGTAVADACGVRLTAAAPDEAGSAFWPESFPSASLWVSFRAEIGGGTGADGMTVVFADPVAGAGALGGGGGGLGFTGIPGYAVTLDTYQGLGDPADNFVGLLSWQAGSGATLVSSTTNVPDLRDGPRQVDVVVVAGSMRVLIDGTTVLSHDVALPERVLVGFTAATGGATDEHRVCDALVAVPSVRPGRLAVEPATVDFGAVEVNASSSRTIEIVNVGDEPIAVTSVEVPSAPFAVASTIPVGRVLQPGERVAQAVTFQTSTVGSFTGSFTVASDDGFAPSVVSLSGSGVDSDLPRAEIVLPSASQQWTAGQTIAFEGRGVAAGGLPLPASALEWTVTLHHCDLQGNCHAHPLMSLAGVDHGEVVGPDHDYPSYLELALRVTDANGSSRTVTQLQPQTAVLTFDTVPSGLDLVVGGAPARTTPFSTTAIVGSALSVTAPDNQVAGSGSVPFDSWSNGGAATHVLQVPPGGGSYVATYQAPAGSACSGTVPGAATVNGAASVVAGGFVLTPAAAQSAGSVVFAPAVSSGSLRVCFDAVISPDGADGMTLMLLDPAVGPTALGGPGGGVGFSGLPGVAVVLDTWQNPGDPSSNFVGVVSSAVGSWLTALGSSSVVPVLDSGVAVPVVVEVVAGRLTVSVAGSPVLDQAVVVPPEVLVGFSAGTGGGFARHEVRNISVQSAGPAPLTAQPASVSFGSVPVGSSQQATVTITNPGPTAVTVSSASVSGAGFALVGSATGATIPAGASIAQVVSFSPSTTGPATGALTVAVPGRPALSVPIGGDGTAVNSACSGPVPGAATVNGAASVVAGGFVLTPAAAQSAGSVVFAPAVSSGSLRVCFDAVISPDGADGMTLMLLDPAAGPTALGGPGGGLGFSGLPGVAVVLDTWQNPGDPSSNFVGVVSSAVGSWLTALGSTSSVPTLDSGAAVPVVVEVVAGRLTVSVAGSPVLDQAVVVPPEVLVGFSAGTGGGFARHEVRNISVQSAGPIGLRASPATVDLGSVSVGSTAQATVTITNPGPTAVTVSSASVSGAGFALVGSATGIPVPAGASISQAVSFTPGASGPAVGSLTIAAAGQPSLVVPLHGAGSIANPSCAGGVPGVATVNGAASVVAGGFVLTPAAAQSAGSVVFAPAVSSGSLRVCFDAVISPGGADGMTLMLLDPAAGPTALGGPGGGLGFSGLPGVAVVLDTWQNPGDPSSNFVGVVSSAVGSWLTALGSSSVVPVLDSGVAVPVVVEVVAGRLTVSVAGSPVLDQAVVVPPEVLVGFSAGTGGGFARHEVRNISVQSAGPAPLTADSGAGAVACCGASGASLAVVAASAALVIDRPRPRRRARDRAA